MCQSAQGEERESRLKEPFKIETFRGWTEESRAGWEGVSRAGGEDPGGRYPRAREGSVSGGNVRYCQVFFGDFGGMLRG